MKCDTRYWQGGDKNTVISRTNNQGKVVRFCLNNKLKAKKPMT